MVILVPSEPYNVTVQQRNGSHVEIEWLAPKQPNGQIIDYIVSQAPPIPPIQIRMNSNTTSYLLSSHFEGGTNYSFWVSIRRCLFTNRRINRVFKKYWNSL